MIEAMLPMLLGVVVVFIGLSRLNDCLDTIHRDLVELQSNRFKDTK